MNIAQRLEVAPTASGSSSRENIVDIGWMSQQVGNGITVLNHDDEIEVVLTYHKANTRASAKALLKVGGLFKEIGYSSLAMPLGFRVD